MTVDQRATSQAPDPLPPELMRMLATTSRQIIVHMCGRAVLAKHPGGVVSRPRTGGIGDAFTTVAGPAIHGKSETGRLECETGGRNVVGCPRKEGSA